MSFAQDPYRRAIRKADLPYFVSGKASLPFEWFRMAVCAAHFDSCAIHTTASELHSRWMLSVSLAGRPAMKRAFVDARSATTSLQSSERAHLYAGNVNWNLLNQITPH